MGNIGDNPREYEFEPLPEHAQPEPEYVPAPEPEKVPEEVPA